MRDRLSARLDLGLLPPRRWSCGLYPPSGGRYPETAAARSSEALARLRWHWTLDEANPERVSLREYARSVDRQYQTITVSANGYALFVKRSDAGACVTLNACLELASMSAEKAAVTEAVANARGVSVQTARNRHRREIREIRDIREAAASSSNPAPALQDHGKRGVQAGTAGE